MFTACAATLLLIAYARTSAASGIVRQGSFSNPQPVTIQGYSGIEMEPSISRDGQYLFFNDSNAPDNDTNLFYATRIDDTTFSFQGEIGGVNSTALDAVASMDSANNFYFVTTRSYGIDLQSLYQGVFSNGAVASVAAVSGVSRNQPGWVTMDAEISPDGNTLYFVDAYFNGGPLPTQAKIVIANKNGGSFSRQSNSSYILQKVNASGLNYAPDISGDGLELYFTRLVSGGQTQIYVAKRSRTTDPFGTPQALTAVNTGAVEAPSLSPDGKKLYYHKQVGTGYQIYMASR